MPDLARFINHNSFAISAVIVLGAAAALLLRAGLNRRNGLALAAMALAFGVAWLALRTGSAAYADAAEVEALVGRGQPVMVEFYSDY